MKLAQTIKAIMADPAITALSLLRDGQTSYVYAWNAGKGVQMQFPGKLAPMGTPFAFADLDDSQRLVLAKLAQEVEWTLFRGGLPLEDDEAPKVKRGRR